ncbi:MAG: head-tail connector protein [Brevundimonas sp.]
MALDVVVLTLGPLLTMDEAKDHLRVDTDDEDELIQLYTDAAVQACLTYCDLKLVPVGAEPSFKAAALLNLGDLYGGREAVTAGQSYGVNPTAENLLRPFRTIRI